ncbi:MAG: hypothetical protein ACRELY_12030 [Polyangiaceae bacterium]
MHRVEIGALWFRYPLGTEAPERRVRASRAGLEVEGKPFVSHDAIERAFYAPREGARGRVIVIVKHRPRIAIEVLTRDEAKRLLAALGFGADRKQLTFTAESMVSVHGALSVFVGILAVLMGMWSDMRLTPDRWLGSLAFHSAIFFLAGFFLYWLMRSSIVVGIDGIAVRRAAVGRRKFTPYDEIVNVRHAILSRNDQSGELDHVLVVDRKWGDDIRVSLRRGERNEDDAAGLVERIQEAMEARKSREIPVSVESMLERGERSVADWIEALRQIRASEEVHYRVAAVDREALFGAVEDATKKPETRIAAAIALGTQLDDQGRARLRVSAEAVAEPKLRVALEQVAEGADTEALTKILGDLDATEIAEG